MKEKREVEMTAEAVARSTVEHPFLHGLSRTQLTVLTDCALPAHFRSGKYFSRGRECRPILFNHKGDGDS